MKVRFVNVSEGWTYLDMIGTEIGQLVEVEIGTTLVLTRVEEIGNTPEELGCEFDRYYKPVRRRASVREEALFIKVEKLRAKLNQAQDDLFDATSEARYG